MNAASSYGDADFLRMHSAVRQPDELTARPLTERHGDCLWKPLPFGASSLVPKLFGSMDFHGYLSQPAVFKSQLSKSVALAKTSSDCFGAYANIRTRKTMAVKTVRALGTEQNSN